MKGIMSVIEVLITGVILILAFYHFFPRYVIRSRWDRVLLEVKVRDVLNTIDALNKTYEFAKDSDKFNEFMENLLKPEVHGAMVWWKEVEPESEFGPNDPIPYFTEGYKETIVDVAKKDGNYLVYTFTLGLGYPY